jgi:hypothetical protein
MSSLFSIDQSLKWATTFTPHHFFIKEANLKELAESEDSKKSSELFVSVCCYEYDFGTICPHPYNETLSKTYEYHYRYDKRNIIRRTYSIPSKELFEYRHMILMDDHFKLINKTD